MTAVELTEALKHANVKAFLKMLRYGEGTSGADGYRVMFGGRMFDNGFVDHPREANSANLGGKSITSTAAGAYQFLSKTWTRIAYQCDLKDFSPASQDLAAVALIRGRGALEDVITGRFNQAVGKCNREWASLPGSPYGQPVVSMEKARSLYEAAGGSYDAMHAPIQPTKDIGGKPVTPFLLAALPSVLEAVPKLISIFGTGSEVSQKNAKAVEAVIEIAKTASGAANEQDLSERLQDPATIERVRTAIEENWFHLTELSGGVENARKADAAAIATGRSPFASPSLLIALALLPLVYAIVGAVVGLWGEAFSDDVRSAIANGVIGLILGGLIGYYYGQTTSNNRAPAAGPH